MEEPMVTITLEEYNRLRDAADFNKFLMDKIMFFQSRVENLENRVMNIEMKK